MGNILEMLYDLPCEKVHGQDSPFVRMAHGYMVHGHLSVRPARQPALTFISQGRLRRFAAIPRLSGG